MTEKTKKHIYVCIIIALVGFCVTWTAIDICGWTAGFPLGYFLSLWMNHHIGDLFKKNQDKS